MAKPTKKPPEIEKFITHTLGGTSRTDAIEKDKCALCGKSAKKFKDAASEREYRISGLCQKCQDKIFDGSMNESFNVKPAVGDWVQIGSGYIEGRIKKLGGDYILWSDGSPPYFKEKVSDLIFKGKDKVNPKVNVWQIKESYVPLIAEMIDEELHEAGLCNECILCKMKELGQTFGVQPNRQRELAKLISTKPTSREKLLTIARFGKDVLGFRGDRLRQFAYAAKNVLLGGTIG